MALFKYGHDDSQHDAKNCALRTIEEAFFHSYCIHARALQPRNAHLSSGNCEAGNFTGKSTFATFISAKFAIQQVKYLHN